MPAKSPLLTCAALLTWALLPSWNPLPAAGPEDKPASEAPPEAPAAKQKQELVVDLALIRRAVVNGILNAREGKQALEFDQLRRDKEANDLSTEEVDTRLQKIGLRWEAGVALLKKLADATSILKNGGFETGESDLADGWSVAASHPPIRTKATSHGGMYSVHSKLTNDGVTPCEGLLRCQTPIVAGETYRLEFWIKPVAIGPSYVTQYHLQWVGAGRSTGFVAFTAKPGKWTKITVPELVAPPRAKQAFLTFRFVTGAVAGGHGEMYIDDIVLR